MRERTNKVVVALLLALSFCVAGGGNAWAQKASAEIEGTYDGYTVIANPGDATAYRGENSLFLNIEVTGDSSSSVWGDGIYTDDSAIAAAAVHAGLLQPGQTGVVPSKLFQVLRAMQAQLQMA
jgi:hypothetical protein